MQALPELWRRRVSEYFGGSDNSTLSSADIPPLSVTVREDAAPIDTSSVELTDVSTRDPSTGMKFGIAQTLNDNVLFLSGPSQALETEVARLQALLAAQNQMIQEKDQVNRDLKDQINRQSLHGHIGMGFGNVETLSSNVLFSSGPSQAQETEAARLQDLVTLPPAWEVVLAEDGSDHYYHNFETGVTQWERPE